MKCILRNCSIILASILYLTSCKTTQRELLIQNELANIPTFFNLVEIEVSEKWKKQQLKKVHLKDVERIIKRTKDTLSEAIPNSFKSVGWNVVNHPEKAELIAEIKVKELEVKNPDYYGSESVILTFGEKAGAAHYFIEFKKKHGNTIAKINTPHVVYSFNNSVIPHSYKKRNRQAFTHSTNLLAGEIIGVNITLEKN